ncbi:MAG: hypothetical protein ACXVPP_11000, partial [Actinomycetota bacterium]
HAQESLGQTVVMVTHDARAAAFADEVVLLLDGEIADTLDIATGARVGAAGGDERAAAVLTWIQAAGA